MYTQCFALIIENIQQIFERVSMSLDSKVANHDLMLILMKLLECGHCEKGGDFEVTLTWDFQQFLQSNFPYRFVFCFDSGCTYKFARFSKHQSTSFNGLD